MGAAAPFPIQAATIPVAMAGQDVLGRGKTGSGKTIAFGVPLVAMLAAAGNQPREPRKPRALVLAPTRELAEQIDRTLSQLAKSVGFFTTTIYGGVPQFRQEQAKKSVSLNEAERRAERDKFDAQRKLRAEERKRLGISRDPVLDDISDDGLQANERNVAADVAREEPSLVGQFAGAVRWTDPLAISSPGDLVQAYARLFEQRGGAVHLGDAMTLRKTDAGGWQVDSADGHTLEAKQVVVALGPWTTPLRARMRPWRFRPSRA